MAAVDGLISGIDVTSIVSQLVQVDSATQNKLKANVTTAQSAVSAYQSVSTKMQAIQTAADNLKKATSWSPTTATSSSTNVAVTAGSTASTGSLAFTVTALASTQSMVLNRQYAPGQNGDGSFSATEQVNWNDQGFPLDVVKDGKVVGSISPTTGTISELAASINAASDLGVKAVALKVADGKYKLQITASDSGSAGAVSLLSGGGRPKGTISDQDVADNLSNGFTTISSARDAELDFGNGLLVTSSTNTFADIVPGVTITAAKADVNQPVTIGISPDKTKIASAMQALVDAANAALTDIRAKTKPGTVGPDGSLSGAGALVGDSTLRSLQNSIISSVTSAFGRSSAASVGVQSTKEGLLTFDQDKFLTAYTKDPVGVRNLIAPTSVTGGTGSGLIEKLSTLASNATRTGTGLLTSAIAGRNSSISDLTNRIADWDLKLAARKERYQKYYSALETALGKLQNQSTYVASQLSSLS